MKTVTAHIIEGCKKADRASQQQLYDHCYEDMIKLCLQYAFNKDDAAVLYNTAMMKVFSNIYQCKDSNLLMSWVRKIVVNTAIDHYRQKIKDNIHPVDIVETNDVFIEPDVYNKISAEETLQMVKELPINAALVFNLFVIEGYKHEEISKIMGIAVGTSKWQLNEARKLLKQKLELAYRIKIYSNVI